MRQRAGGGGLWRAIFSEEVAAMMLYLPSAESQDVEGGRGRSWEQRIDSMA